MVQRYIEAIRDALTGILNVATQWALPLSLLVGLLVVACVLGLVFGRERDELKWLNPQRLTKNVLGYTVVGVLLLGFASALKATKPAAQHAFRYEDQAEARRDVISDAPIVSQSGPAVAALEERTYSSSLTLPPSFLNRLNAEGLNVLAPYLADSSTQNVIRLRNNFKRSGRNAVFTRDATVLEEKPVPILDTNIKVTFGRLAKRAFDAQFEGHYRFGNTTAKAMQMHFLFSLPQAGTVSDLHIVVGKQALGQPETSTPNNQQDDPGDPNVYEWKGEVGPGETREALVTYRVVGARVWSYDLGSTRRRVEQFHLDAQTNGDVAFARGSLQPTSTNGSMVSWQLSNVVTDQQLSLVFPSEEGARQLYLQSLSAFPASLVLFALGLMAVGKALGLEVSPLHLGVALTIFALGLGASTVATTYFLPLVGLIVCPLLGAVGASIIAGRRALLVALPCALLPAAFLNAQNSGLLVLVGCLLTLGAFALFARRRLTSVV